MKVPVEVMPLPTIIAAGIQVPDHKCKMWAPCLTSAKFHVNANAVTKLNVVVIYHRDLEYCIDKVYCRLRDLVNNFNVISKARSCHPISLLLIYQSLPVDPPLTQPIVQ